jgi:DNA-binding winged helix-turn-helix (wHTH) protein/tetratricopeptide (TPR) repeat protein
MMQIQDLVSMTANSKTHLIFTFGPFRMDVNERLLSRGGKVVPLAPKLFDTLALLVENAGRVVEKNELMEQLWHDTFVEESSLSQNIFQLRKVLKNGRTEQEYIETIPKRGYRFAADVLNSVRGSAGSPAYQNGSDTIGQDSLLKVRSLAVMPFTSLGVTELTNEYLGLGMADATIIKLSGLSQLTVMPTRTMLKYAGRADELQNVAREHGVNAVLEGAIQRSGERVRVTVQLLSLSDGAAIWSGKFDENFTDIFSVQDSISEQLADALSLELTSSERQQLKKHGTQNTQAYQAYLMGLFFSNKRTKEALSKSIDYFRQSIELDADYALAYARIADSFFWLAYDESDMGFRHESFELSRSNALKAIELDPSVAEAHAALATVKIKHDHDPAGADASFRQAIAVDPNCAMAYSRYTYYLAAMGRLNEAHETIRRAQEIDPLSPDANASLAIILYMLRDYDDAIRYCRLAIDLEPRFAEAALILGRCFEQKGLFAAAVDQYSTAAEIDANGTEADELLGHIYAITGREAMARERLSWLLSAVTIDRVHPYNIAAIYAALGENELAFEWLEKPFINWTERLRMLRYDPRLDSLRADRRFTEIVERSTFVPVAARVHAAAATYFPKPITEISCQNREQ